MSFPNGLHVHAAVGMEELQVIKKELTLIKTQIDGLLDSLDRMDTKRSDHKGETFIRKDSGGGKVHIQIIYSHMCSRNVLFSE